MIEETVRPAEVAAELGLTTEDVVRLLDGINAEPLEDWRGAIVIRAADARKLVETARAEELERRGRQIALEAASRAYGEKVRRVFEQALAEARQEQRRKQAEAIKARVAGDPDFTVMMFNGQPEPGALLLDPVFEQRAQAAARRVKDEWVAKNPMPDID